MQQLTTHLAIYTNTRLGVEVLRVISANFPCSCFKMSSRVKEQEKEKKKNQKHKHDVIATYNSCTRP